MKLLLIAAALSAIQIASCRARRNGPKLIEADGVTYIACGGALWVEDENPREIDPRTFEVLFQDVQGINHELKRVRTLKITDLPDHTPECAKSTSPQWRGNPPSGAVSR